MRILVVLFLLLLAPQGSRPQSILNLRYVWKLVDQFHDLTYESGARQVQGHRCHPYSRPCEPPRTAPTHFEAQVGHDKDLQGTQSDVGQCNKSGRPSKSSLAFCCVEYWVSCILCALGRLRL